MDFEYRYSATANDGRIVQLKDWVNGEEVNHQCDELGRLIASATTGPQWGLSWTYDGFGNRLAQNVTKGTAPVVSLSINAATNRITTPGFAYDAAGNLVQWPGGTVTIGAEYDVEGRLSVVRWDGVERERYFYDARNLRVKRWFFYQVYGLSGELLGEYQASAGSVVPQMWRERVYFAGRLVATMEQDATLTEPNTDRLGSIRAARRYPFGEESGWDRDEFATYRKDTSTQHYYAWHRYYSATWGRFSSPDPYIMSGGLTNPQGWNRYSYVANDPVNYHDPQGLQRRAPGWSWVWVNVWTGEGWSGYWHELASWGTDQVGDSGPGAGGPSHFGADGMDAGGETIASVLSKEAASAALRSKLAELVGTTCWKKLFGGQNLGSIQEQAAAIRYFDGRSDSGWMDQFGGGPHITFAEYHQQRPSVAATVLLGPNNKPIANVVLWSDFFGAISTGNPTPLVEQKNILWHEFVHVQTGLGDEELVKKFNISTKGFASASAAFDDWLTKKDCGGKP